MQSQTYDDVRGFVPIDNYDHPVEPFGWWEQAEWIWYNDEGGYDD